MAKKLVRSNLSDDAYSFLRDLFVNGKRYNPGDKISVEELSSRARRQPNAAVGRHQSS